MALPEAITRNPACGVCGTDTKFDGDEFVCHDCGIYFDPETLAAEFLDSEAAVCGEPCDNQWHGDHKIWNGVGHQCGTCELPAGHNSLHWTDCKPIPIKETHAACTRQHTTRRTI